MDREWDDRRAETDKDVVLERGGGGGDVLGHGAEEARKACRMVGWGRMGKGREDREAGACENDVICISLLTTHTHIHTQQVVDLKTVRAA
jgi:hypothetical protein